MKKAVVVVKDGEEKKSKIQNFLDKLIFYSLFMLFLGLPLFFLSLTTQGIFFEKQIYFYFWSFVALSAWVFKGVAVGKLEIKKTPLDIPILVLLVTYSLSTFFSVDRWHSFFGSFGDPARGMLSVLVMVLIYYLIFSNFNKEQLRVLLKAMAFSGSLVIVWTLLALLNVRFLPDNITKFTPLSLIGGISDLSVFISVTILLLATTIFDLKRKKGFIDVLRRVRFFLGLVFVLLGAGVLFLVNNFIFWSAVVVGVLTLSLFVVAEVISIPKQTKWLAFLLPLIVFFVWILGNSGARLIKIRMPIEVNPGYKLSWEISKESVKKKTFFGSGPGMYAYNFSKYKPATFNNDNNFFLLRFQEGKGIFLESLATIGVLGTIAVSLIIIYYLAVSSYLLISKKEEDKIYSLGSIAATLTLLVYALFNLTHSTILLILGLLGALSLAIVFRENKTETEKIDLSIGKSTKSALLSAMIFLVISTGVIYLFVFVGKVALADFWAGESIRAKTSQEKIDKISQAIRINPKEGMYYLFLGQYYMISANEEMIKKKDEANMQIVQQALNNSIKASEQAKKMMPNNILVFENLGQIYENASLYIKGLVVLMEKNYQEALALDPQNPLLRVKLGQIKLKQVNLSEKLSPEEEENNKKNIEEAKKMFSEAISLKKNFSAGYYNLALAEKMAENIDGAIENMKKAVFYNPNDINMVFALATLLQERGKDEDNQMAEVLLKKILGVNDKEINSHFSLAQLYQKSGRKEEAIQEYKKVQELLPEKSVEARKQIDNIVNQMAQGEEKGKINLNGKVIENQGIGNTPNVSKNKNQ